MAIISDCAQCGQSFWHSVSNPRHLCERCNGSIEKAAAEEARWCGLSVDEKLNELRQGLKNLTNYNRWDGRLG